MNNPYGPNCRRLMDVWPTLKLDPRRNYWFGRVAEGQDPPKGKVVKYSRTERIYLVETK